MDPCPRGMGEGYGGSVTTWPDLAVLELLVAVAETGSIGAAAAAVGTGQPSASRSLLRLERRTGVTLLQRTPSGTVLTAQGALVVDWARDLLAAAARFSDAQRTLVSGRSAVTVAASMTIAEYLLPRWLVPLRTAHPDVEVALVAANSTEVARAVRGGEADIGFVEDGRVPSGLHSTVVASDRLVVVVAPGHPWARRRRLPVTASELAATALLVREAGSGTRVALEDALGQHGLAVRPALELTTSTAVRIAALSAQSPAVLSELAVAGLLASGELVEVRVEGVDLTRELRAVWTGSRRPTGMVASVLAAAV